MAAEQHGKTVRWGVEALDDNHPHVVRSERGLHHSNHPSRSVR